jgi:hypothetical protein
MQIYVHRNGQQLGPFTEAEISAQLAAGTISRPDLVWWEGQPRWMPLGQSSLAVPLVSGAPPSGVPSVPSVAGVTIQTERTSGMAIAALVCGVGSFLCVVTCIPAIILGHLSLSEIKRTPGLRGRGMALAGLIIGYAYVALFGVVFIISFLLALGQTAQGVFSTINSQLQQAQGS